MCNTHGKIHYCLIQHCHYLWIYTYTVYILLWKYYILILYPHTFVLIKIWTKMKSPLLLLLTNIFAHRIDDIEQGLDPDPKDSFKVIAQKTKVKDHYFDLLKSSKKEIMLIYPSIYQQPVEVIDLVKQVAKEKNVKVRVLVPVRVALFPLKENQQDSQ
jgi:hypothetical protein